MTEHKPLTTTIYMTEEDHRLFALLREQTGLSKSALVRRLIMKAAVGEEGSDAAEVREHVAALARLVL